MAMGGFQKDDDDDPELGFKQNFKVDMQQPSDTDSPSRGRLSDRLLQQGLLTPRMLKQLREELGKTEKPENFKRIAPNRRNKK